MSKFVNSKIKLNIPKINQLSKAATIALEQTTTALNTEVNIDQVVPYKSGNLSSNIYPEHTEAQKGKDKLISPEVYSRRLYFHPEYNFNRNEHKNAKGKWWEDYISGYKKDFCSKTFTKSYKKGAGL